jgi:RNA polymerase sigma-70 factor (ECF subfamily)
VSPAPINPSPPLWDRDKATVTAAISGGSDAEQAYRMLMDRYGTLVHRSCLQLLSGETAEADEAAQDVWIQVHRSLPKFEGRSTFRSWLFSVVENVCRQRRRSLARQSVHREAVTSFVSESAEIERAGAPALVRTRQAIDEAFNLLNKNQQRIIVMRFLSGLSIEEIADSLGVKLSTAKMRLYRAIDALREVYTQTEAVGETDPLTPMSWIQLESEIRSSKEADG